MSVEAMRQALLEKRAAETTVENNENQTQQGVNNVRLNPPDRPSGSLDSPWGEKPKNDKDGYPVVYSTAVEREDKDGRADLLGRLFDVMPSAATADQKLIADYFTHRGELESHSSLLQKKASAHEPSPPTLGERVRALR